MTTTTPAATSIHRAARTITIARAIQALECSKSDLGEGSGGGALRRLCLGLLTIGFRCWLRDAFALLAESVLFAAVLLLTF